MCMSNRVLCIQAESILVFQGQVHILLIRSESYETANSAQARTKIWQVLPTPPPRSVQNS